MPFVMRIFTSAITNPPSENKTCGLPFAWWAIMLQRAIQGLIRSGSPFVFFKKIGKLGLGFFQSPKVLHVPHCPKNCQLPICWSFVIECKKIEIFGCFDYLSTWIVRRVLTVTVRKSSKVAFAVPWGFQRLRNSYILQWEIVKTSIFGVFVALQQCWLFWCIPSGIDLACGLYMVLIVLKFAYVQTHPP